MQGRQLLTLKETTTVQVIECLSMSSRLRSFQIGSRYLMPSREELIRAV